MSNPYLQEFAARLEGFRMYMGLSQAELAELAWGHRKFGVVIAEMEQGRGLVPPILMEMLAPALGVEIEDLIV